MSSIKTTELQGDMSIGRHLGVGGNASVQGNATVKKNLKVEGWLDAKNIKGPNKGIFTTVAKLREAYGLPHDGWWALVGNSLPAALYIADGGAWVATGEQAGNPTIDSQQYNEAVNELSGDLTALTTVVSQQGTTIQGLQTYINTIGTNANNNTTAIGALDTRMQTAETNITALQNKDGELEAAIGNVYTTMLPTIEEDNLNTFPDNMLVVSMLNGTHPGAPSNENNDKVCRWNVMDKKSRVGIIELITDNSNCTVVELLTTVNSLDAEGNLLLNEHRDGLIHHYVRFFNISSNNISFSNEVPQGTWSKWQEDIPKSVSDRLAALDTFMGSASAQLGKVSLVNMSKDGRAYSLLTDVIGSVPSERKELGVVLLYLEQSMTDSGLVKKWASYQWKATENSAENWNDLKQWEKFGGGGAAVGNTYNVTVEQPLATGEYYTDIKATEQERNVLDAVWSAGVASLGLQITFAIGVNLWKTYQYTGANTTEEQVKKPDNWIDLAGMSAGGESVINVNDLCGDKDYTLSTAVNALIEYEASTGIGYRKEGLVITYRRDYDSNTWETKQYQGKITDLTSTNERQWVDFGGGGNAVELTNEAEMNSEKAITSGGVYEALQTKPIVNFNDESDAENYVFQGVNEKGENVGDPLTIPKSNGGGQQAGSTLNIYPETQAVWGAFGSNIVLRAAIKSVSYDGDDEVLGTIKTIAIVDALTKIVLWSSAVNQPSSTSASDYKFNFDFTDFITEASSKDFIIQAMDADGNKKTRTITVTAVDVTCQSINTLNYSSATSLEVGGSVKSLPMYKFENNVSTKSGILVTTEIWWNGEWKQLGTATVTDSYSHNVSIDPKNVFGEGEQLTHGAWPIRIKGKDIVSGVEGNTVYTAVMCIDKNSTEPVVAMRYNDNNGGKIRLYDTLSVEIAAYTPGKTSTLVNFMVDGKHITERNCIAGQTYPVQRQVQGYKADGSKTLVFYAESDGSDGNSGTNGTNGKSVELSVVVEGSAISAIVKDGALFAYDFSTRSNDESDHTITDGGYEMTVEGSNYSSNGFKKLDYYNSKKEVESTENVFRCAENVKATIPWSMFGNTALETSGAAFQMAFSTNSIKDPDAKLCECFDSDAGVGFYITGNKVVLSVTGGSPEKSEVTFKNNEKVTVAVVVEPGTKFVTFNGTKYSFVKLYVNGEECAAIGYQPGKSMLRQTKNITFNSEDGDINVHYILAYNSYMEWLQAFQNYLCMLSQVEKMIAEYASEDVLDTTGRPSRTMMDAVGIPYYVVIASQQTFDNYDFALNGGTDTNDVFACTLKYYNPKYPCLNFEAKNVYWRRQGTTSAKRPVKNDRFNLNKKFKSDMGPELEGKTATVTLLNPDDTTELGRRAIMAARHNKVFVDPEGFAVDVITVKVDYSDSSNANDCGVCNMMNATFRALGRDYMTPAQRSFDGTQTLSEDDVLTDVHMDHSTKNHPIAQFRATTDTMQDAWFHAKGNWKEDKGEQTALGFKDTPGYNLGCLNYGDFKELFTARDQSIEQFMATQNTSTWDFVKDKKKGTKFDIVVVSEYCGRNYRIYRKQNDGQWAVSNGSMKQEGGQWHVTGDVLNPVTGFELLKYNELCWWQGVSTIDDMMELSADTSSWVKKLVDKGNVHAAEYPKWTQYFECMVDDDQLQIDLAEGRKVPYELYNMLLFFNSCDYSKVDGWRDIWKQNAWKYMSMESVMAYTAFTDYAAAVDQRAKNMQPMFFLEDGCYVENGVYYGSNGMQPLRMYLNKVYDCDTCNGSDNDGGRGIDPEVDPNKPSNQETGYSNPYMGSGSVLFNDIDKEPEVWNSANGESLISLNGVVKKMRTLNVVVEGGSMSPFSPEGALKYFVKDIINFWPKVICSYDGERKYINHTHIANAAYFYALHGSGRTSLPRFIEQRWAIRDGYYLTGGFYSDVMQGRIGRVKENPKIYITAAKTGYFGIGNDGANVSESVYLEAGQSYAFTKFDSKPGTQLLIYQPSRLSKIDLSELVLNDEFNSTLSNLKMCEEIILGGEKHLNNSTLDGYNFMSGIVLGNLPFLRKLDVSKTTVTSIDASGCPRLEEVNAMDTPLLMCRVAQTSPVSLMQLPDTITTLELVNLPNLSYPGGLSIGSVANVNRLWIEGCPQMNVESLVMSVADGGKVSQIRLPRMNMTASVDVLRKLKQSGAVGLDSSGNAYEESGKCSGLTGRWILSELIEDDELQELQGYFSELELHNSQFSIVRIDDIVANDACEKYTNDENKTGMKYGNDYVASGHVLAIRKGTHAYKCSFNESKNQMEGVQLSDDNFAVLANGSSFDNTDSAGEGYDIMWHAPHHWYKGVNDYKNQVKYIIYSTTDEQPISTASVTRKKKLSEILHAENSGVYTDNASVGSEWAAGISTATNCNVYKMDVEGMKQVRWPGMNNARLGAMFVEEEGKVIGTFNMSVSHAYFDFSMGSYVFCDVPSGAKWMYFTTYRDVAAVGECIAVDSASVEAIEPEWTEHKTGDEDSLVGIYPITVDALMRPRSISGAVRSRKGNGTSTTSTQWNLNSDGDPTNQPQSLNYTCKDFQNSTRMRGKGFQLQDYEQHKEISNLWWALNGTTNEQGRVGNGAHDSTLNSRDSLGMNDTGYVGNAMNSLLGLKHYVGCDSEWMDYIACNVVDWETFYKRNKCVENAADPVDYKAHIYDPIAKTERVVQTVTSNGNCVVRLVHGAKCDILPSKVHQTDTSRYATHYAAAVWLPGSRGRCVLRSGYHSNAYSGLAYARANYASSYSSASFGGRLAFRGKFVIIE